MSPTTLKMISQLKLHLLQGDNLLARRKARKQKSTARDDSEYENMKAYDSFLTPAELEAFEEGVFTEEQNTVVSSRQDAFIDSIFDFEMFERSPPQADNNVIEINDDEGESNGATDQNWDPQELWIS